MMNKLASPHWIKPMKATLTDKRFDDSEWVYEPKYDGVRCLAIGDKDSYDLMSRNHQTMTQAFPEISNELNQLGKSSYVLDGEIVVHKGLLRSFRQLQHRLGKEAPAYRRRT